MATQSNNDTFTRGFAKVLEEQWQVDIRLKAKDTDQDSTIFAHKLVLAARSKVFKMILESDEFKNSVLRVGHRGTGLGPISKFKKKFLIKSRKQIVYPRMRRACETVTLSELKHEELEALVEFIYSDGSILSTKAKHHVRSLYFAADKYEIPHLRDLCRNELIYSLNSLNALDVLELSLIPFDKALNDSTTMFVISNLKTICDSDEFKLFVGRNPDLAVDYNEVFSD